jgi:hypothetical protein
MTILSTPLDKLIRPIFAPPHSISALKHTRAVLLAPGLPDALRAITRLMRVNVS